MYLGYNYKPPRYGGCVGMPNKSVLPVRDRTYGSSKSMSQRYVR